jgi:hypothetical protein
MRFVCVLYFHYQLEVCLGRVINIDGVGKERNQLTRAVILALRELMRQTEVDGQTHDLAAFIALALESIAESIDISVSAWEKRGYWLKADRFRMDWAWTGRLGETMRGAILEENWPVVASTAVKVAEKLKDINVPQRNRLGTPWVGAWDKLNGDTSDRNSNQAH